MTQLNKNKKIIRILFNFDSFQYKLFKPVINKIIKKANLMNILIKGTIYLPTKKKRFIVLRSPHVYKKSREQFELKTHRRALVTLFDYTEANKQKAKIFINFIKNSCGGLNLKITYKTLYLKE